MFCGKAFNGVTKKLFHDANSKRGGVLMHSKVSLSA
jgi:tyrosyl-DNA phosphodiesterase-1